MIMGFGEGAGAFAARVVREVRRKVLSAASPVADTHSG
jgi:hypothetical protein